MTRDSIATSSNAMQEFIEQVNGQNPDTEWEDIVTPDVPPVNETPRFAEEGQSNSQAVQTQPQITNSEQSNSNAQDIQLEQILSKDEAKRYSVYGFLAGEAVGLAYSNIQNLNYIDEKAPVIADTFRGFRGVYSYTPIREIFDFNGWTPISDVLSNVFSNNIIQYSMEFENALPLGLGAIPLALSIRATYNSAKAWLVNKIRGNRNINNVYSPPGSQEEVDNMTPEDETSTQPAEGTLTTEQLEAEDSEELEEIVGDTPEIPEHTDEEGRIYEPETPTSSGFNNAIQGFLPKYRNVSAQERSALDLIGTRFADNRAGNGYNAQATELVKRESVIGFREIDALTQDQYTNNREAVLTEMLNLALTPAEDGNTEALRTVVYEAPIKNSNGSVVSTKVLIVDGENPFPNQYTKEQKNRQNVRASARYRHLPVIEVTVNNNETYTIQRVDFNRDLFETVVPVLSAEDKSSENPQDHLYNVSKIGTHNEGLPLKNPLDTLQTKLEAQLRRGNIAATEAGPEGRIVGQLE